MKQALRGGWGVAIPSYPEGPFAPSTNTKALRELIVAEYGDIVGTCVTNETHNPENGDALQITTGGLMVWRKADNWTVFTDGSTTWLNGPVGLQSRSNSSRFDWEGQTPAAATPPPSESAEPSLSLPQPTTSQPLQPPADFTLRGSGQQATQPFRLEKGISVFNMSYSSSRNFIVELLDSNGRELELIANEIGSFQGSKAVAIERPGEYLLNVDSSGSWVVTIQQPRPSTAPPLPFSANGRGVRTTNFFSVSGGLTRFHLTHNGNRNFIVELLDINGKPEELLVNVIGKFDGSKAVGGLNRIYLLNIDADGEWSVSIE